MEADDGLISDDQHLHVADSLVSCAPSVTVVLALCPWFDGPRSGRVCSDEDTRVL